MSLSKVISLLCVSFLGATQLYAQSEEQPETIPPVIVNGSVYKTKMEFFGKKMSGLFAIKPIDSSNFRMALFSELGPTLLDMTFDGENYTINTVIEQLDRPLLLDMVQSDLSLLMSSPSGTKILKSSEIDGGSELIRTKPSFNKRNTFYINPNQHIDKIEAGSICRKKQVLLVERSAEGDAEKISVEHNRKDIKLTFELLKIR